MPRFGELTGKMKARVEKFRTRLNKFEPKLAEITGKTRAGIDAVLSATARYLASFGSEVARLNKVAHTRLIQMDATGRQKLMERAVAEIMTNTKEELQSVFREYARGRIDIDHVRAQSQTILRTQTLASAIIGVGGVGNLTENVLSAVQRQLSVQFEKLDGFLNELSTRVMTQRDLARVNLYANSSHTMAQIARRQFSMDQYGQQSGNSSGELEEKRVLGGAEHCEDCIALASLGWSPLGSLPAIGTDTVCGDSCRCSMIYRNVADNREQAAPQPDQSAESEG